MKIAVISPLFAIAGVPLAQLRFARALARMGHEVDLVLGRVNEGYTLPAVAEVNVIVLDRPNVRSMFLPFCSYLRRATPDVVFSAEDHLNVVVLMAAIVSRSKAKFSGSSRVTPFDTYSSVPFSKRWILKQLSKTVMWRADALTCVSEDMVEQYRKVFRSPPHVCVYNIVDDHASRQKMRETVDHPWLAPGAGPLLVAAGRLAYWKGFVDLIQAMHLLSRRSPARLLILGDGPQKAELLSLIRELELEDRVQLTGYVENPLKYFARADIFVLSSHVEGLPNVLVEAMMCGCTPVATDCPTGPREVLRNGEFGYLVPVRNPAALAAGIEEAIRKPIAKELLGQAIAPFEESVVITKHFQVLGLEAEAHQEGVLS